MANRIFDSDKEFRKFLKEKNQKNQEKDQKQKFIYQMQMGLSINHCLLPRKTM